MSRDNDGSELASSQAFTKVSSYQRRYPMSMKIKFMHLLVFDCVNILLSGLNHYYAGIAIHFSVLFLHTLLIALDYTFRKRNCKKEKKYSQTIFDIVYYLSAYVSLMALLLYFFNAVRKPTEYSSAFPNQCLGQYFNDSGPIKTVCNRVSHSNSYNFDFSSDYPVGFQTTTLQSDIQAWFDSNSKSVYNLYEQDSISISSNLTSLGFTCKKYIVAQLQDNLGFMQDMMIVIIQRTNSGVEEQYLELQSQLRVGLKDYDENTINTQGLLAYLKSLYPNTSYASYPTASSIASSNSLSSIVVTY